MAFVQARMAREELSLVKQLFKVCCAAVDTELMPFVGAEFEIVPFAEAVPASTSVRPTVIMRDFIVYLLGRNFTQGPAFLRRKNAAPTQYEYYVT